MARISRRNQLPETLGPIYWNSASYARLSLEDNGRDSDESIVNQADMIETFAKRYPEIHLLNQYIDNGKTGTDFNRPEWERLMTDVNTGEINCIIVKDLSRLGRNYIEAGEYLEKVFPSLGVRFISINDQYDSESILFRECKWEASLRNLINDFYSKDISRKVHSSFQTKKNNGFYIGSSAPYGYQLRQGKLQIDGFASGVVQRIYKLKSAGLSDYKIAELLNEEGIACPSKYKCNCGDKRYCGYGNAMWQPQAVKRILKDEVYIGNTVHRYDCSIYSTGRRKMSPESWQRIEGTHEALVDKQLYHFVRRIYQKNENERKEKLPQDSQV